MAGQGALVLADENHNHRKNEGLMDAIIVHDVPVEFAHMPGAIELMLFTAAHQVRLTLEKYLTTRDHNSVSKFPWADTTWGLLESQWKKKTKVFRSLPHKASLMDHLWDKKMDNRKLSKGNNPEVSPLCPICGATEDGQGHYVLMCNHPALCHMRIAFGLQLKQLFT